jgi:hypothetical protein
MTRFRSISLALAAIFLLTGVGAAQGGKAEANRIDLPETPKMKILTSRLQNSREMEYVFAAKKGESIVIVNPNPSLFDVRIFHPESEFDTEYDSSKTFEVDIETDGDHFLFIRRKVGGPRTAAFRITIGIKKPSQ